MSDWTKTCPTCNLNLDSYEIEAEQQGPLRVDLLAGPQITLEEPIEILVHCEAGHSFHATEVKQDHLSGISCRLVL